MKILNIAIQGVPGSFHHQVALEKFGEDTEILSFNTFEPVTKSVANGDADFAVMAIENSIAGAIFPNYELLDRYELTIRDEYYLPIAHQLMALPGQTLKNIREVRSHPMALLQCKAFFAEHPNIELKDDIDTAAVAKQIASENWTGIGAIASTIAADIYGLEILAKDIQTVKSNFTRFFILQKQKEKLDYTPNKASIKVTLKNEKGVLAKLLSLMSKNDLDLSKIQSVPVIHKPWEYSFFIDTVFENHAVFTETMAEIQENFGEVKIFGEYISRK